MGDIRYFGKVEKSNASSKPAPTKPAQADPSKMMVH